MRYIVIRQAFRNGTRLYPGDSFEGPDDLSCKYAVPAGKYEPEPEQEVDEFSTLSELARAEARPPVKRGPGRPPKVRASDEQVI